MIYLDPGVYSLGRVFTWLIFYYVFKKIYRPSSSKPLIVLFIVSLFLDMFVGTYSYFLVIILIYFVFCPHLKLNIYLLNTILLSILIGFISETIANVAIVIFYNNHLSTHTLSGSLGFIGLNLLIKLLIAIGFVYFYRHFDIETSWDIKESVLFGTLIGYLFIVLFVFMQIIRHYQAYSDLLSGILLFILIQCTFIVIIFLKSNQIQKQTYSNELANERLRNLKMYTDQLEHDQIKLRGFEHNYKNMIADLRDVANTKNFAEMKTSLGELENYSDSYFDNVSMQLFKDLNNVKNPYLKSLLISKLTLINQHQIKCHFECRDVIDQISINIFDLVRLLGISIDNAIEATENQENGEIQIAIIKEAQQLTFLINNTTNTKDDISKMMQEGFTTKKNHSGFGMANMQDIKKKYPDLFIQYRKNSKWFNLSILIIK